MSNNAFSHLERSAAESKDLTIPILAFLRPKRYTFSEVIV